MFGDPPPNPYRDHIIPAVHRLLGSLDRAPGSPTRGSFSRDAWLYRFPGTFHPATRQCAVYPLARLYATGSPGNEFHNHPVAAGWIRSALAFTLSLQNRDGSFPEWYRGQASFCATAYLAAYLAETGILLRDANGEGFRGAVEAGLERAATWLGRAGTDGNPGNQAAAALHAFHACGLLLGTRWEKRAETARDALLRSQSGEGWFPEYGGADLGYQSLSLDFLVRSADRGLEGVRDAVDRGIRFIDRWVPPDGSCPSALCWRGTGFLAPFALERWAPFHPAARRLASRVRAAALEGLLPTPVTVDDRYAAHLLLPSFLDAYLCATPLRADGRFPAEGSRDAEDPEAGLFTVEARGLRVFVQARKGTYALCSEGEGRVAWDDHGFGLRRGAACYVAAPSDGYRRTPDGGIERESAFRELPGNGAVARIGTAAAPFLAGALSLLPWQARASFDRYLKRKAFTPGAPFPARWIRRIAPRDGGIEVTDRLECAKEGRSAVPYPLLWGAPANTPSASFFGRGQLQGRFPESGDADGRIAQEWSRSGTLAVETRFADRPGGASVRRRVNGVELLEETAVACLPR